MPSNDVRRDSAPRAAGGRELTEESRRSHRAGLLAIGVGLLTFVLAAASHAGGDGETWAGGPLEVVWNDDAGRAVELPLVTSGDRLFVTTTDKKIYCYDLETGKKAWKRRFKVDLPTAPAVLPPGAVELRGDADTAGGLVFLQVGAREGSKLHALREGDGKDVWKLPSYPRATQLEVVDGFLFLLDLAGTLQKIDPSDGSVLWDRPGFGWDAPGFVTEGGVLYVLARSDSLVALDAETGDRQFGSYVPGRYAARPRLDGRRLLLGSTEGGLYDVRTHDGSVRRLGKRRSQQLLPPVGIDGRVLTVSSDGWVEAEVPSGPEEPGPADGAAWTTDLGEAVRGTPIKAGNLVLVPTSAGRLVALRGDNGAQVWSLELGQRLATAPLLTERYLIVATNQGDVYAYTH